MEWSDGKLTPINNAYNLYYKEDERYYYMAVQRTDNRPFYIDMFISHQANLYNIHASTQLGERWLNEKDWSDEKPEYHWGNNKDWIANMVLFDRKKIRQLRKEGFEGNINLEAVFSYNGFEFQFSKSRWDFPQSKFRIEMRDMFGMEDFEEIIFPENSTRYNDSNWFQLK